MNIFRDSGLIAIAGIRVLDRTRLDTVACDSYEVMEEEYDQLLLICLNEGEFIRRSLLQRSTYCCCCSRSQCSGIHFAKSTINGADTAEDAEAYSQTKHQKRVVNLNQRGSLRAACLPHTKYIAYSQYISCLTYVLEQRTLRLTRK